MEEQIITVKIKTKGDLCQMSTEEIKSWSETNILNLFNLEYGKPEITVDVKREVK